MVCYGSILSTLRAGAAMTTCTSCLVYALTNDLLTMIDTDDLQTICCEANGMLAYSSMMSSFVFNPHVQDVLNLALQCR